MKLNPITMNPRLIQAQIIDKLTALKEASTRRSQWSLPTEPMVKNDIRKTLAAHAAQGQLPSQPTIQRLSQLTDQLTTKAMEGLKEDRDTKEKNKEINNAAAIATIVEEKINEINQQAHQDDSQKKEVEGGEFEKKKAGDRQTLELQQEDEKRRTDAKNETKAETAPKDLKPMPFGEDDVEDHEIAKHFKNLGLRPNATRQHIEEVYATEVREFREINNPARDRVERHNKMQKSYRFLSALFDKNPERMANFSKVKLTEVKELAEHLKDKLPNMLHPETDVTVQHLKTAYIEKGIESASSPSSVQPGNTSLSEKLGFTLEKLELQCTLNNPFRFSDLFPELLQSASRLAPTPTAPKM